MKEPGFCPIVNLGFLKLLLVKRSKFRIYVLVDSKIVLRAPIELSFGVFTQFLFISFIIFLLLDGF